jgi:dolichol kinase
VTLEVSRSVLPSANAERVPVYRPANLARTIFHVGSGGLALVFIRTMPTRAWLVGAAAAFASFAWTCELVRRRSEVVNERLMRFFGPVAHPHEWREVNSATWYATALFLMALVVPRDAAEIGVVVLAVADPMAGFVGRRLGRRRLASGRSLEGAAAFAVTGALAALAWTSAAGTYEPSRLVLAAVAGIVGAAVELLVSRVDDNLAIPLGTSLAVALAALAA